MRKILAEDLYKFHFVSGLTFSPDGSKTVFTVSDPCEKTNSYRNDLWLLENGEVRPLTAAGDVRSALWLDNDTLLFPALRTEEDKALAKKEPLTVYQALSLAGGEPCEYMRVPLRAGGIKALADGSFVCMAKYDFSGEENKDWKIIEENPFWRDGDTFCSKVRPRLYLVKNGSAEPLTGETELVMSWTVNGNDILYSSHTYEGRQTRGCGVTLIRDGRKQVLIEDSPKWGVSWVGFLDGQPIAAMKKAEEGPMPGVYALGKGEPRLLFAKDETVGSTTAGDSSYGAGEKVVMEGDTLYYAAVEDCSSCIRRYRGGEVTTLLKMNGSIDGLALKNGRLLASCVTEDRLPEIYEVKDGALIQITSFNEEFHRDHAIALPKALTAVNEGGEIHGFVLEPAFYEEGKTYPAILDIHGGPFAAYGTQYFHEMQLWASAGYFVFFCNPRGGDGRGTAFADLNGRLGTIDYQDLMTFTDKVLESYPMIDKNRLGITGGSYGGYMTNWVIGHTDRFAAAASQRSIANWGSENLTTDIGLTMGEEITNATPWRNGDLLWEQSPLKYANRAKTPTLFIHSENDYRCWMGEGLQMFSALKLFGVPSKLVLFHGESHGLSRIGRPCSRVRRLNEITAWMDQYLK